MTDKKCIIFTGGDKISPAGFEKSDFDNAYIIAADSGCVQIEVLNENGFCISPDMLLGDMDSFARDEAEKTFPGAEFVGFPPEKDYTDTQLAMKVASEKGYTNILIAGGTGGRIDHMLSNLAILRKYHSNNICVELCDGKNKVFYFAGGTVKLVRDEKYKYFSLIPDERSLTGVSITGAKYPLSNAHIDRNEPITVSNEIVSGICEISVEKGSCFIVQCSD